MSQEQYSPIRFQLEESIWLDHHSQHAEIISLELEPDIEVVEERDYISITGSLLLNGRFEPVHEDGDENFDLESSSLAEQLHFQPLRVEQKELYEEDLRGKIEKKFPLDVAVPTQKIDNLDDVYVLVEQLDYSVTDGHRLNIVAEVVISGIKSEATLPIEKAETPSETLKEASIETGTDTRTETPIETPAETLAEIPTENRVNKREGEAQEEKTPGSIFHPPLFPAFDVAASQDETNRTDAVEQEHTYEEKTEEKIEEEQPIESFEVSSNRKDSLEEHQRLEEEIEEQRVNLTSLILKKERSYSKPDHQESRTYEEQPSKAKKESSEEKVVPLFDNEIRTVFHSLPSNDQIPVQEVEEPKVEEEVSQTTSFLTKLMAGTEDEESRSTMLKVCIIQKHESLEVISDRYSVPVRDIVRVNRLDSEQVSEGEIIYIPKM